MFYPTNYNGKLGKLYNMKFIKPSYIIKFLVLFVCYVITGKVGLEIGAVSGFATLVWLPAGISLAFLLLYGYRLWPATFLGALSVNLLVGAPLPVALGIGVGNTLEALLGFFILKKVLTFRSSFDRLRDVISLTIIAGPLAAAVSATIGVLSLFFSHIVLPGTILITWITWWTGDVISIFIVSPLLISWIKYPRIVQTPRRIAEIILLMLIVVCSAR